MTTRPSSTQHAFTLVELLVAIVILSILATAGVSSYVGSLKSARDARRKADVEQIRSALELYRSDNAGYPQSLPTLESATVKKYISLPKDPLYTKDYGYTPQSCPTGTPAVTPVVCDGYYLGAVLENTASCGLTPVPTTFRCQNASTTTNCTYCVDPYGKL